MKPSIYCGNNEHALVTYRGDQAYCQTCGGLVL